MRFFTPNIVFIKGGITIARIEKICYHYISSHHKTRRVEIESVSSQLFRSGALVRSRKKRKRRRNYATRKETKKTKRKSSLRRSNAPIASIVPPRHAPNPLFPTTLKIALGVKVGIVHVALEIRLRTAVIAKQALHVQELARRLLVTDGLAVFVGFALFRDVVGQSFGGSGVHVRAARFRAPDGSVGRGCQANGGSFGFGGSGGDGDCDEGGRDGDGDCDAVDVFGGGGGGEAFVGSGGGCDEGGDVDC